ncbi:MAG: HAMP domain-containing histidine kinase, partial [Candidatus Lokiarchaeota archaeon]|nr:HAMP domain-containing histidine kinase [Candidatus Lokiarchaeota archaeon]
IAAHELKTPMVSITGYTDYILTHNKDLDFEIRKDLLLIQKNSQRLNLLIEKLLDVMKIDAKKMDIIREEKNIYDIIENCVEELSFQINDKKLNVIVDVQKDLYLRVDPNRIYEVFSNLFSNAVKFTLNGGNIEISAKKIKNQFLFKVRNEGKGLNIRDIRKLFKKFEVIEKESADHINRKKGLGLGLYISKGVVEAHGGKIWGTSKGKNKGAEFYFTLPIIEA